MVSHPRMIGIDNFRTILARNGRLVLWLVM
jgi:hypothetical protein